MYTIYYIWYLCHFRSTVRVVTSNVSGTGKSLYIRRLAEKLQRQCQIENQHIIVPIHGPMVSANTVMASLCNHIIGNTPTAQIIHFDIASSVSIAITLTAGCIHILCRFFLMSTHCCSAF